MGGAWRYRMRPRLRRLEAVANRETELPPMQARHSRPPAKEASASMIWDVLRFVGLAVAVTATMMMVDFAGARHSLALYEHRKSGWRPSWREVLRLRHWRTPLHAASRWSVVQWGAATVGFVVAVKVSIWFVPFEGLGLKLGTLLGGTRPRASEVSTK